MKVYIGTVTRIAIERKCGCRATQEFSDPTMNLKSVDDDATFKPCAKHKRGILNEVVKELLLEVLENKAEEHRSKASIAIAEANASRREEAKTPTPAVGEGAVSETRTAVKIGGRVVQRPGNKPPASAGVRRAPQPATAAAVVATHKTAAAPASTGNAIDDELAGAEAPAANEDPRITKVLVDEPGGLLGPDENDSTEA